MNIRHIDRLHLEELIAFIADVKVCGRCDTTDLSKVTYCNAHRVVLNRMTPKPGDV